MVYNSFHFSTVHTKPLSFVCLAHWQNPANPFRGRLYLLCLCVLGQSLACCECAIHICEIELSECRWPSGATETFSAENGYILIVLEAFDPRQGCYCKQSKSSSRPPLRQRRKEWSKAESTGFNVRWSMEVGGLRLEFYSEALGRGPWGIIKAGVSQWRRRMWVHPRR